LPSTARKAEQRTAVSLVWYTCQRLFWSQHSCNDKYFWAHRKQFVFKG